MAGQVSVNTYIIQIMCVLNKCDEICKCFCFRAAGIACVVINGVVKNGLYVVGERCLRRSREKRSQWNAVLIDGEWRLLDVLWASCALVRRREKGWKLVDVQGEEFEDEHIEEEPGEQQHKDNEFFFLTDPDWFVSTHFPDDPDWQLLPRPLSIVQFETIVYIRERFFDMGLLMQPDSQRYCVMQTNKGEVTISFGIPQSLGYKAQFSYMLYYDATATAAATATATAAAAAAATATTTTTATATATATAAAAAAAVATAATHNTDTTATEEHIDDNANGNEEEKKVDEDRRDDAGAGADVAAAAADDDDEDDDGGGGDGDNDNDKNVEQDSVADNDAKLAINWKGCVFYRQTKEQIRYVCLMPTVGRYRMDIFGRRTKHDNGLDLVCSYVIECNSTDGRVLPDNPDIGWGPGIELEEVGLSAVSHPDGVIDTDDPVVTIQFSKTTGTDMAFWQVIKHDWIPVKDLKSRVTLRTSGDDVIAVLRLPEAGMYAYKLFADDRGTTGDIPNVCNYLVRFKHSSGPPPAPFPPLRWGVLGQGMHAQAFQFQVTGPGADGYIETSSSEITLALKLLPSGSELVYELLRLEMGLSRPEPSVTVNARDVIDIALPESGEYALNIFVRRSSDDYQIYHVHSVYIVFSGPPVVNETTTSAENNQTDEESTTDQVKASGQNAEYTTEEARAASVMDSLSQFSEEADEPVTPQRDDTGKPDDTTCVWCDTCEDSYDVDLPQSEHKLMIAAERKAAQHSTDYIEMKRTGGDNGDVVNVRLPKNGDYIIDVFDVLDNNLLDHVRCTHVTRLVEKVTHFR